MQRPERARATAGYRRTFAGIFIVIMACLRVACVQWVNFKKWNWSLVNNNDGQAANHAPFASNYQRGANERGYAKSRPMAARGLFI